MPTISTCDARRDVFEVATVGGETTAMPAETVFRHGLRAGVTIPEGRWRDILREAEEQLAYDKVLLLLGNRQHTRTELSRKLYERGFKKNSREAALDKAARLGLVDDALFARLFAEEKLRVAGWGRRRLVGELRKRGVAPNTIEDVLAGFEEAFEAGALLERATQVAEQRRHTWEREVDPRKRRDKLFRLLSARGFDGAVCFRVWETLGQAR